MSMSRGGFDTNVSHGQTRRSMHYKRIALWMGNGENKWHQTVNCHDNAFSFRRCSLKSINMHMGQIELNDYHDV